jgi:hypothetical protein
MSDFLFLARDFIEHMVNPAHGVVVNEEYALRFASLLQRKGFEDLFLQEIRDARDQNALTSHGWLWLVGWAKSRNIDLPTELLVDLFEEWSDVFVKTTILDLATRNAEYRPPDHLEISITDFPNDFLRRVMLSAVRVEREEYTDLKGLPRERGDEIRRPEAIPEMNRAESLLVSLLQVGRPITLGAASTFLRYEWQGQRHMLNFFRLLYERLDEESRTAWSRSIPFMPTNPEGTNRQ